VEPSSLLHSECIIVVPGFVPVALAEQVSINPPAKACWIPTTIKTMEIFMLSIELVLKLFWKGGDEVERICSRIQLEYLPDIYTIRPPARFCFLSGNIKDT